MAMRLVLVAALLSVACNRGPIQRASADRDRQALAEDFFRRANGTLLGCDRLGAVWYCDGLLGGRPVRAECSVAYGCLWSYGTLQAGGVSVEVSR